MMAHQLKMRGGGLLISRRIFLLFCLFAAWLFAAPAEGQLAQTNPTSTAACGLPTFSRFTSAATVTTFTMTADCTFGNSQVVPGGYYLWFQSGTFTINGGGYRIIGPTNALALRVQGSSAVLNLNNVTIRQAGAANNSAVQVDGGGTLNASSVTFSNNANRSTLAVNGGTVAFTNVQFLNSSAATATANQGTAMTIFSSGSVTINNGIFQNNSGQAAVIVVTSSTLIFNGCLTFSGNTNSSGGAATNVTGSTVTDNNTGVCTAGFMTPTATATSTATATPTATATSTATETPGPGTPSATPASLPATAAPRSAERRSKDPPPDRAPTATPQPAYAASYVALQTDTGMTFEATYGLDSGVHFRQLDGGGIGVQSIIDAGPLAALDVYGYVEQGVEVCFPQIGRVVFLDARTMPRAITSPPATVKNGMTCVYLNSPGSLVLLPAG